MEPAVLTTKRKVLAQLVFCVGCCCGRVDRGRPEVPVEKLKEVWRAEHLNRTVQLTISGCLGPCDVPNVVLVILPEGNVWLGGLAGDAVYGELVGWARGCHAARRVLPLPPSLNARRFARHGDALATDERPSGTRAMKTDLFGTRPRNDPAVIDRLKRWTAEALRLPDDTPVMVTELRCAEEGCPDVETVIAVLDTPGRPRQFKVFKPLGEVTRDDLGAALTDPKD